MPYTEKNNNDIPALPPDDPRVHANPYRPEFLHVKLHPTVHYGLNRKWGKHIGLGVPTQVHISPDRIRIGDDDANEIALSEEQRKVMQAMFSIIEHNLLTKGKK